MAEKARDIKRRVRSVESTKKITNAMQLIAASRILRAQAATERSRPYSRALSEMIEMLASEVASSPLLAERQVSNTALIVITGDRGLAGGYNSNILRETLRAIERERADGHGVHITNVGRKGQTFFKFRRTQVAESFTGISDKPTFADAARVAAEIIDSFVKGRVDRVLIAYTDFVSAAVQRARVSQVLPAVRAKQEEVTPRPLFEFEPEPDELLNALLPRYVETRIFAAMLESSTSEHAARMRAMKSATDKASDLITLYQRRANKARQGEITNEIADIVGAAEALRAS